MLCQMLFSISSIQFPMLDKGCHLVSPSLHSPPQWSPGPWTWSPESATFSFFTAVCLSLMGSWRHWHSKAQALLQRPRHCCRDPGTAAETQALLQRPRHCQGIILALSVCCPGTGRQRNCLGHARGDDRACSYLSGRLVFRRLGWAQVLAAPSAGPIRKLFLSSPLGCACLLLSRAFSNGMQPRVGAR